MSARRGPVSTLVGVEDVAPIYDDGPHHTVSRKPFRDNTSHITDVKDALLIDRRVESCRGHVGLVVVGD